jgi:serine/threonine-protein kinase
MAAGAQQLLRGRFEVLGEIGEGGFARVYHARETTTGQKVALKVLKDGFQNDKEVIERFRREVFAVASINSPHVVGLKDFGMSGSEFFIAMEFVEGVTLRDVLEEHSWSADSVHTIIGQVAAALEAAHAQNIVHRDLKPENVMIVQGPNSTMMVKVLDFGLAKLAELERNLGLAPLTRVGMCFGTPQYMSPELIYGKPVDRMVDLFALAVMAYEMIAGRRPWDGTAPQEVMVAVAKTPLPPIVRTHTTMARQLDVLNRFFARALHKKKDERPPDAATFFGELSMALYGERRAFILPRAQEATAELSAIQSRLPAPMRRDETQIDVRPVGASGERTVELQSQPQEESDPRATQRSGRLAAIWIPSIASTPSIEESVDLDSAFNDEAISTTLDEARPRDTAPSPSFADTKSMDRHPDDRRGWVTVAIVLGLAILIVGAAALGFVIGRGH